MQSVCLFIIIILGFVILWIVLEPTVRKNEPVPYREGIDRPPATRADMIEWEQTNRPPGWWNNWDGSGLPRGRIPALDLSPASDRDSETHLSARPLSPRPFDYGMVPNNNFQN